MPASINRPIDFSALGGNTSSPSTLIQTVQGNPIGVPVPVTGLINVASIPVTPKGGYVAGALAGATVAAAGTAGGYVPGDTFTLPSLPDVLQSATIPISTTGVVAATITAAGTYTGTTGTYTVTGTTGTGTKFTASCTLTNGSGITAILSITNSGSYTVNPTTLTAEPVMVTNLTGATLNIKMGAVLLGTPTVAGTYAPTTLTNLNAILAAQTPVATSGSGNLTGISILPSVWNAISSVFAAANVNRQYLWFKNESPTQSIGLSLTGSAAFGSVGTSIFLAGGSFEWTGLRVIQNSLSVIGQSAFQQFTLYEG